MVGMVDCRLGVDMVLFQKGGMEECRLEVDMACRCRLVLVAGMESRMAVGMGWSLAVGKESSWSRRMESLSACRWRMTASCSCCSY